MIIIAGRSQRLGFFLRISTSRPIAHQANPDRG